MIFPVVLPLCISRGLKILHSGGRNTKRMEFTRAITKPGADKISLTSSS